VVIHVDWDGQTDLDMAQRAAAENTAIVAGNHTVAAVHFLLYGHKDQRLIEPSTVPERVWMRKVPSFLCSLALTKMDLQDDVSLAMPTPSGITRNTTSFSRPG